MILTTLVRQLTLRLALFATLVGAFAPAVFWATGDSAQRLIEVCSVSGSKQILINPAQDDSSLPAPLDMTEHCFYCRLQTHLFAWLPEPAMPMLVGHLQFAIPTFFLPAPRTLHGWISAQPRAPPEQGVSDF